MRKNAQFKMSQRWSLIGFAVPVAVIGAGLVIPGHCIAGINDIKLAFVATIVGAGVAYLLNRKGSAKSEAGHA